MPIISVSYCWKLKVESFSSAGTLRWLADGLQSVKGEFSFILMLFLAKILIWRGRWTPRSLRPAELSWRKTTTKMAEQGGRTHQISASSAPMSGAGIKPVPMKLFSTWEIDKSTPSCIPRYVITCLFTVVGRADVLPRSFTSANYWSSVAALIGIGTVQIIQTTELHDRRESQLFFGLLGFCTTPLKRCQ